MSERDRARARRAAGRAGWAGRLVELGDEGEEDLGATTTAEERLGMMWRLALDAWTSSGRPLPSYARSEAPGRLIRRSG